MNNNIVLVRIEQALDRVERRLKMIDTRVGQLHAAANFSIDKYNTPKNKKNKPIKKNTGGGYFAKNRPMLFGRASDPPGPARRLTNSNFAKMRF